MRSVANAVILLWGWRSLAAAFVAGALSALAQAPTFLAPILFLTLPVLVWLIDGSAAAGRRGIRRLRPAFAVGWWFGFGYFLAGLWWIGAAFLVEAEEFGWMLPFAVVGLPALLALFTGAGVATARLLWVEGPARILALGLGLTSAELLRGHLFTGFPWILLGQAAGFTDVTAQAASVVGVYGLTAVSIVVFAAPAVLADPPGAPLRRAVLGLAVLLIGLDVGYGAVRLAGAQPTEPEDGATRVRIVQPSIDQSVKWDESFRQQTLDTYLELSDSRPDSATLGALSFSLLVWPETALPFFLTEEPTALARIGSLLTAGTTLLTGAPRIEPGQTDRRIYNSVFVVDDGGRIVDAYDKSHLVPFGEYMPMQGLFDALGLTKLTGGVGGFSEGPGVRTVTLPNGLQAGILVCYEIIFPGEAVDPRARPDVLVNVTNDAWYGRTPGPYQHLDLARMRAIEEGLPVVRAANSGVSALIDPYGRILSSLPLGQRGVLDGYLTRRTTAPLFSTAWRPFLFAYYVFSVAFIAAGRRKSARER